MDKFSEADIAKIINDCEILILPDEASIEDFQIDNSQLPPKQNLKIEGEQTIAEKQPEETEEDFEAIFQASKANKQNIPTPSVADFSYLTVPESSQDEKPERVLIINRLLKERLVQFRKQLYVMLEKIDAQYRLNNIFLEQAKSGEGKDSSQFKTGYTKCGAPFFKDATGRPAPFNDDYKHRKNVLKQFFPFDMPVTSTRWKTSEKVALIGGVKRQMIDHIKSKQSQKLCKDTRQTRGKLQKLKFIASNKDMSESPMNDIFNSIQSNHPDFAINWNIVSFNDLHSNHSVSECMGMWYSYLKPDINREPFTNQENLILANIIAENNYYNWNEVASKLDRRSSLMTFVHFHSTYARLCPNHIRWTEDEDQKLFEYIQKYSVGDVVNWCRIGQVIPHRNKTQCYNRYQIISKNATAKKGVFSKSEDRRIIDFVKRFGEKSLHKLPKDFLAGRSLVQIRSHYMVALKHNGTVHPWTKEEDRLLVDHVGKHGTADWAKISDILKTHNRLSCRTRFLTLTKFLAKNPGARLEDAPSKLKRLTAVQKAALSGSDEDDDDETVVKQPRFTIGQISSEKFKKQSREMYNLFRTAYNFDLGARSVNVDNSKMLVLMALFNVQPLNHSIHRQHLAFTSNQLLKYRELLNFKLNDRLVSEMKFVTRHTQFLMPPNFNTTIGLRALTVKINEEPLAVDVDVVAQPSEAYSKSLEIENFQKLFFSLFYWSAMLTKIDRDELNEIHFMKYPKSEMTATDIFRQISKRKLNYTACFKMQKCTDRGRKRGPPAKKQKLSK